MFLLTISHLIEYECHSIIIFMILYTPVIISFKDLIDYSFIKL